MKTLSIGNNSIRQFDGLYSLNDLHKAAGGADKHRPGLFVANAHSDQSSDNRKLSRNSCIARKCKRGGTLQGTYGCKELVYAYAMWISPAFMLQVIRAYDTLAEPTNYLNTRHGTHAPAGLFSGLDNGRYLLVATKGEVILRDIAGCNIVKADSVRKIQQDLRTLAEANLAMQQRLSVLTGDASTKLLDAPLNIGIGWEQC